MNHESNEFVPISDLMASFVGVIVMLLVVSMAQNAIQAEVHRKEQAAEAAARNAREKARVAARAREARKPVDDALQSLRTSFEQRGVTQTLLEVNVGLRRIRLRDATFKSGSACVAQAAAAALQTVNETLLPLVRKRPKLEISVVGHTDSDPVAHKVHRGRCAMFDDNLTLSAARAREARAVVVAGWEPRLSRRVSVSGYGDMQPLEPTDPAADVNRRVEISLHEPK